MKKKTQHLACYLIKEGVETFFECLRDDENYSRVELNADIVYDGIIILGQSKEKAPSWVEFLNQAADTPLSNINNKSTRAILFLKTKGRIFAYTFGYGRHLLKDSLIVNDFGFRIAINSINPKKIKSMDIANLEELTVQSRIQTSISSEKESFGIDILNDLLRAVTGIPKNPKFANQISGRDGIVINSKLVVDDLEIKARLMLHHYRSTKYKEYFDWVDNLKEERDKLIIEELKKNLILDLNNRITSKMTLAPEKVIEWEDVNGFCYSEKYDENLLKPELYIDNYVSELRPLSNFDDFKKDKVFVNFSSNDVTVTWPVYKCLTYETDYNNEKYVFTLGHWYKIETKFVKLIIDYVKTIPISKFPFPDCDVRTEDEYNKKFLMTQGCYVLDKLTAKCELARTEIEPCDILTSTLQFIHVKQKHNSANLSHLFSQCRISAESLIKDVYFRQEIVKKAKEIRNYDINFLPTDDSFKSSDCEIIIAIIRKGIKPIEEELSFFSLLNLRQSSIILQSFNYKVSVALINKI